MKGSFNKLCNEIKFNIPKHLEGSFLDEITQQDSIDGHEIKRKICLSLVFYSFPHEEELLEFCNKTANFFKPYIVEFAFNISIKNYTKTNLMGLINFYFHFFKNEDISVLISDENCDFNINKNILCFKMFSHVKFNLISQKKQQILDALSFFNIDDIEIQIENGTKSFIEVEEEKINKENEKEFRLLLEQRNVSKTNEKFQTNTSKNTFKNNSSKKYFQIPIKSFYDIEESFLLVEGMIFFKEMFTTKTNLKILTLQITDFEEALVAKFFLRDNEDQYAWIEPYKFVSIYGEKKSGYNGELFLQINKISEIQKDEIIADSDDEARVELSARSSMSSMDGFIPASKLLKHAKNLNHKALAIVDFQNIQAFPEIYNSAKKIGVKPIYGATFSTINHENGIVANLKNKSINEEKYIIFDLETTSLNPRTGEIIEFGAVEMENGRIIKTHQFFIRPSQKISAFTTNLTGITQQMLESPEAIQEEKQAIEKIIDIFNDHTLVAHNAKFDISFINEKIHKYNLKRINNQVIDTLSLAKFLIEISQNYRLETVSKKYGILYDPTVAHRADYDAQVLQKVWAKMIEDLTKRKILTFEDLDKIEIPYIHNKKIPYDLTIYAKNQAGLKELFKLVSQSCTSNYFGGPRLFCDKLAKSDNLLFAPVSINTKLIDLMFVGTTEDLKNEILKWDFIGIPSPILFSHLVSSDKYTIKEIKYLLKEVILLAKQLNKTVVAVGDVRYLMDNEIIGHHVYINTKGLEGRRHPLYRYNDNEQNYPIQKYLTTREMKEQFEFLNSRDLIHEIVVTNSNLINNMIDDNIEVIKSKLYAPNFDDSSVKLKELVYQNAHKIYGDNLPKIVEERINHELTPIIKYGFSVVYWISHKLVAKSNQDGYLVGSRGSVGSSLVATLSGITEVNPLIPHYICLKCQYSEFINQSKTSSGFDLPKKDCPNCGIELKREGQTIPFETFLGFNADKVPDIDLNFSGDYQPIIHQEVKKMFGESHSFRAGTIATVASKTAFGFVKKWNEEKSIGKSNIFINYLSSLIEGSKRTTGQHPGGIIIIPKEFDVEDFTPVNYPANDTSSSWLTTHFDFHAIHDNVLKLDLLGHDDPTVIKFLQSATNVKLEDISFSDPKVMSLFSSPEVLGLKPEDINDEPTGALGIPEFGTRFVRRMLNVAKPKTFNDLINLSGLSHGTDVWTGNAEELIKSGMTLNEVISCRDDIMIYLIKKGIEPLFSFTIMEKVRKGKGLTREEETKLKDKGIEQWYINSLNKIKYMFPKAHATAYVMMAWRIAWFKIYYPLEYYASYFSIRTTSFDIDIASKSKYEIEKKLKDLEAKQKSKNPENKISAKEEEFIPTLEVLNEMKARGIDISNIDLYKSDATKWKIDYKNNLLIPPFLVLDGLGDAAAKSIVNARDEREFYSIEDLVKRTQLNKTIVEKLTKLGVFNNLDETDQIKLF